MMMTIVLSPEGDNYVLHMIINIIQSNKLSVCQQRRSKWESQTLCHACKYMYLIIAWLLDDKHYPHPHIKQRSDSKIILYRNCPHLPIRMITPNIRLMIKYLSFSFQILKYNLNAHESLYSCVKGVVEELLTRTVNTKILTTGHSFGMCDF